MTESGVSVLPDSEGYRQDRRATHQVKIQLTEDDKLIFQECVRESFYYRVLPLGITGFLGVYYASRAGYIRGSKWGYMIVTGISSYILGMMSYRRQCNEKFLNTPNSAVGDMLRRNRGDLIRQMDPFTTVEETPEGIPDDVRPPEFQSFNTAQFRPDEGPLSEEENLAKKSTTYDELRRVNRDQFNRQPSPSVQSPPPRPRPIIPASSTGEKKNTYGDVWDD